MPKRNAPEFSYNPKTKLYRKKVKNPITGKWVSVYGKTKAELRAKIKDKEQSFAQALKIQGNPYVYQYAAQWYQLNTAELGQKRKDDYRNAINNHICPVIGNMLIRDVREDDIKRIMLKAANLSNSSQQKIVTTLRRIFRTAEKNKLIEDSPCDDLVAGGKKTEDKIPLTKAQQKTLLDAVKGTNAEAFVNLGLYAGLRREEILGLMWDCVYLDAETPYITVKRACRWDGKNKPYISDKLKSDASSRNIPIPPQLVAVLSALPQKSDIVVCNKQGEAMSATSFRRLWDVVTVRSERTITSKDKDGNPITKELRVGDKIQKHDIMISIDFPVTPHLLRHTYITELILAGANIKIVQYLAGHKNVNITLDIYTKLTQNQPKDTAPAVLLAFGAKNGDIKNDGIPQAADNA